LSVASPANERVEASRRKINRLVEEVARRAETEVESEAFFTSYLEDILSGLTGAAGAIWCRPASGPIGLQHHINGRRLGIDPSASEHEQEALLHRAFQLTRPITVPIGGSLGDGAANRTDFDLLLAPLGFDGQVLAVVEVAVEAGRDPAVLPGYLRFLECMADLGSRFLRNDHVRRVAGQQKLWTRLEAFARQVHGTLDPTEAAYIVANEGRRLIGCDRVAVAVRHGRHARIEAISGADVVERRATLVRRMAVLCERVVAWGENLVHTGTRDASLPPHVLQALDEYLAASASKLLVVLPLADDRDAKNRRPSRSALVMECFEPGATPAPLLERLEIVGRHSATALYNACEYRRIPLSFLWKGLARLQDGLGGKARLQTLAAALLLAVLGAVLVGVPYPLKMDARGQLLPIERRWLYAPVEGQVIRFEEGVEPGKLVGANQALVLMYDVQLEIKLVQLANEIAAAQQAIDALARQETEAVVEADRLRLSADKKEKEYLRDRKALERRALCDRTNADESRPGYFWLKAPLAGTLLNADFRENLTSRFVKPSDALLRIGDKTKRWELEMRVPQKAIAQIIYAFPSEDPTAELDVDVKLTSCPTRTFRGKLARGKIGSQAGCNRDDAGRTEPVVPAWVRLDGPGIAETERIPPELLVTGTEAHVKVRCGPHALGYSLFYGLWDFVSDKVVFWF
jgi:hypothetical protein